MSVGFSGNSIRQSSRAQVEIFTKSLDSVLGDWHRGARRLQLYSRKRWPLRSAGSAFRSPPSPHPWEPLSPVLESGFRDRNRSHQRYQLTDRGARRGV